MIQIIFNLMEQSVTMTINECACTNDKLDKRSFPNSKKRGFFN